MKLEQNCLPPTLDASALERAHSAKIDLELAHELLHRLRAASPDEAQRLLDELEKAIPLPLTATNLRAVATTRSGLDRVAARFGLSKSTLAERLRACAELRAAFEAGRKDCRSRPGWKAPRGEQ